MTKDIEIRKNLRVFQIFFYKNSPDTKKKQHQRYFENVTWFLKKGTWTFKMSFKRGPKLSVYVSEYKSSCCWWCVCMYCNEAVYNLKIQTKLRLIHLWYSRYIEKGRYPFFCFRGGWEQYKKTVPLLKDYIKY